MMCWMMFSRHATCAALWLHKLESQGRACHHRPRLLRESEMSNHHDLMVCIEPYRYEHQWSLFRMEICRTFLAKQTANGKATGRASPCVHRQTDVYHVAETHRAKH